MPRLRYVLAALALSVVACSSGGSGADDELRDDRPDGTSTPDSRPGSSAPDTIRPRPDSAAEAPGQILVFSFGASEDPLSVLTAGGEEVATLPVEPGAAVWLPTWTPSGDAVVWAEASTPRRWKAVMVSVGGGMDERVTADLPGRPDHFAFGTDDSDLLALAPSPNGFGLFRIQLGTAEQAERIGEGSPFFIDLSPDGARLVAHVQNETRVIEDDGTERILDSTGAPYQTPAWSVGSNSVIYARRLSREPGGLNEIVEHDLDTDDVTVVATYRSFVFFDVDPTRRRLAIAVFGRAPGGIQAQEAAFQIGGPLAAGLWTIDLDTGQRRQVDTSLVTPPQWAPDGRALAARDAAQGSGRWHLYSADEQPAVTQSHRLQLGGLGSYYLQFWDQFGRTQSMWAPDGSAFVYSAQNADGETTVWLQDTGLATPPVMLATGDVAFWSPTTGEADAGGS